MSLTLMVGPSSVALGNGLSSFSATVQQYYSPAHRVTNTIPQGGMETCNETTDGKQITCGIAIPWDSDRES